MRAVSLRRKCSTRDCCFARAVLRWSWSPHSRQTATALARSHSPSARGRGATCQMRPSEMSRLLCGMRKRANALSISQEEAQHASLLNSAPCCVSCGWPMRSKRPLQQPEASLFRHAAVVRRASCSLNDLAGVHMACASAPPHSCISGGGATRELAASARCGALVVVGPCPMKGHCAGGKPLSFGARPKKLRI